MTPLELAVRTLPKKIRLKKAARLLFPDLIEFRYRKALKELAGKMRQAVAEIVLPELRGMVAASPSRDSERLDETVAEKLAALMRAVGLSLEDDFAEEELSRIVEGVGEDLSSFNRLQVHKVFRSVLGIDLLSSEPGMAEVMGAFVRENVSLIKSVESQYLGEVEQVILRGMRSGLRHEAIAKQLVGAPEAGFVSRAGKAEARAELIARDQTNKLYGQLTEIRQRAAGVEEYIWRTALDARVRDEHAAREGEKFSWSDPPSDGHPGEPINCRCYAEPVIDLEQQ